MTIIVTAATAVVVTLAAVAAFFAVKAWFARRKKKPKPDADKAVKEFSKVMIKTFSWASILWITASYILAAFGREVNEGVTIAVVSSLAAVLLGYFIKSFKEKINRNEMNKKGG